MNNSRTAKSTAMDIAENMIASKHGAVVGRGTFEIDKNKSALKSSIILE